MTTLAIVVALVGLAAVLAAWDAMRRAVGLHSAEARMRAAEADARAREDLAAMLEEHRVKVEERMRFVEGRLNEAGLVAGLGRRR